MSQNNRDDTEPSTPSMSQYRFIIGQSDGVKVQVSPKNTEIKTLREDDVASPTSPGSPTSKSSNRYARDSKFNSPEPKTPVLNYRPLLDSSNHSKDIIELSKEYDQKNTRSSIEKKDVVLNIQTPSDTGRTLIWHTPQDEIKSQPTVDHKLRISVSDESRLRTSITEEPKIRTSVIDESKLRTGEHKPLTSEIGVEYKSLTSAMGIDSKIEMLLKNIGERSMSFKWMHEHDGIYYEKYNDKLQLFLIVLSAISAVLSSAAILTLFSSDTTYTLTINIVQILLTLVLTIMINSKDQKEYKIVALDHRKTAFEFARLHRQIQTKLATKSKSEAYDERFLTDTMEKFDEVKTGAPVIRDITLRLCEEMIERQRLAQMDELDSVEIKRTATIHNISIEDAKKNLRQRYEIDRWLRHY